MKLYNDIETRSPVDLRQTGVYVYAEDPRTEILLWSYALGDAPVKVWYCVYGQPMPDDLRDAILDPETVFVAHNADFERILFTYVGKGFLPDDIWQALRDTTRWNCTASRARACGLPGSLDMAAQALRMRHTKDKVGYSLMMKMCKPRGYDEDGNPIYFGSEADMLRLGQYCAVDTEVERQIDYKLPELSKIERDTWLLTCKMNDRGIAVDSKLLMRLSVLAEDAVLALNAKLRDRTDGAVQRVSDAGAIARWLVAQGFDEVEESGIGKAVILEMLEDASIDPLVQEVLTMRRDGGKSSVAKFGAIARRMSSDGRVRGNLIFAGAAATGRWSSTGLNAQNLPRGKAIKNLAGAIDDILINKASILDIEANFGPPMVVLSELLRPALMAGSDSWCVRADFSQIEARMLQFLAGAEESLDAYRAFDAGNGPDLYTVGAANMFGIAPEEVTAEQRQCGKVAALSFGYGGGKKAYLGFAKIYGLDPTEDEADSLKNAWREANPKVVELWNAVENAALECLREPPGTVIWANSHICLKRNSEVMVMRLPSGRHIFMWNPRLERRMMPWGREKDCIIYFSEDRFTRKWCEQTTYGGSLVALATQGASTRDIMAFALRNLEAANLKPLMTVHDEAICRLAKSEYTKEHAVAVVREAMLIVPSWAAGLPLSCECTANIRYLK